MNNPRRINSAEPIGNTPAQMAEVCANIPIGRMADPVEIAKAVYFLCSEDNTYLTGQKITVDGGFTAQ